MSDIKTEAGKVAGAIENEAKALSGDVAKVETDVKPDQGAATTVAVIIFVIGLAIGQAIFVVFGF